ncbi:hypothetical protein A5747_13525 [Mycobacterium sp. IS-836]|nr:hypothetical protein A5747_13525 [Mycobacterium sp. IS-836]
MYEQMEPCFLPDDADLSEIVVKRPPIRQVEVRQVEVKVPGMPADWPTDYVFVIRWSDKDGWHEERFTVTRKAWQGLREPTRVAAVLTDWGRIEVHTGWLYRTQVFVWASKGVDTEPFEVPWSRY